MQPDQVDMKALQEELCGLAAQIADECYGIELDYSAESIQQVDAILDAIHEEHVQTGAEEGLAGISLNFGAYLAAVIERNLGPTVWEYNHPEFGDGTFPLYLGETTIFPVVWCEKRIYDGPSEDVWFKFQVLEGRSGCLTSQRAPERRERAV